MAALTKINMTDLNKNISKIQQSSGNEESLKEIHGEGVVLLKNFSQGTTRTGKPKFTGTIENIKEAKFNVWNSSAAYKYFEQLAVDAEPHVVWIQYNLSKYGFVIDDIKDVEGYNTEDFIHHKYDRKTMGIAFEKAINDSGASEKAKTVIKHVLHMGVDDRVNKRIGREQAAYSHHDNCATGLLAHMTKCIRLYNGIKGSYPFLNNDEKTNDLMVISLAVHDVGKIEEMHDGVYQAYSFLTHRGLGIEHLFNYKEEIVELYDEEFFYMICSVLLQHHGEYGENPRTVYAMLVHMIDDMEAQITSIDDMIADELFTADAAGTKIKYNGESVNNSV